MLRTRNCLGLGLLLLAARSTGAFLPLARQLRHGVVTGGLRTTGFSQQPPCRTWRRRLDGATAGCRMMVDPALLTAGVAGLDVSIDDVAGGLFAASLFPYLAFLYYLVLDLGLWFRLQGLPPRFRFQVARDQGSGLRIYGAGFRVQGSRIRVQGLRFKV